MLSNMFIAKDMFMHNAVYKYLNQRNIAISYAFLQKICLCTEHIQNTRAKLFA